MDFIANNLPQFEGDIQEFEAFRIGLTGAFDQMVSDMNALNTMWEGEAHEQLKATFEKDRGEVNLMLDDVLQTYKELKFAHSEYTTCESNVAGIVDGL